MGLPVPVLGRVPASVPSTVGPSRARVSLRAPPALSSPALVPCSPPHPPCSGHAFHLMMDFSSFGNPCPILTPGRWQKRMTQNGTSQPLSQGCGSSALRDAVESQRGQHSAGRPQVPPLQTRLSFFTCYFIPNEFCRLNFTNTAEQTS